MSTWARRVAELTQIVPFTTGLGGVALTKVDFELAAIASMACAVRSGVIHRSLLSPDSASTFVALVGSKRLFAGAEKALLLREFMALKTAWRSYIVFSWRMGMGQSRNFVCKHIGRTVGNKPNRFGIAPKRANYQSGFYKRDKKLIGIVI
jgi:hypothetical protein